MGIATARNEYDETGRLVAVMDADGNKTIHTYDKNNNLLSVTDANGNTTGYTYDQYNNVTEVVATDGTKVESTYTQENQVSGIQMLDKTVMAMEYDEMGSPIKQTGDQTIDYCCDLEGHLLRATVQKRTDVTIIVNLE